MLDEGLTLHVVYTHFIHAAKSKNIHMRQIY